MMSRQNIVMKMRRTRPGDNYDEDSNKDNNNNNSTVYLLHAISPKAMSTIGY